MEKSIGDRREVVWSEVLNPKTEQMFIDKKTV